MLTREDWPATYHTLDDPIIMDLAQRDPDGFIYRSAKPMIIDEIQKVPDLMRALKRNIDLDRKNGQFLLTGSANIMTLKTVSESLAERIGLYQLNPFSWAELEKKPATDITDTLFAEDNPQKTLSKLYRKTKG
jgi:predicted AAA+ superfamily ATPase